MTLCVCTGELAGDNGGSDFMWEREQEGRTRLWKARHSWYYAGLALQPEKKVGLGLEGNLCIGGSHLIS